MCIPSNPPAPIKLFPYPPWVLHEAKLDVRRREGLPVGAVSFDSVSMSRTQGSLNFDSSSLAGFLPRLLVHLCFNVSA